MGEEERLAKVASGGGRAAGGPRVRVRARAAAGAGFNGVGRVFGRRSPNGERNAVHADRVGLRA